MPAAMATLPGRRTEEGKDKLLREENIPGDILKQHSSISESFMVLSKLRVFFRALLTC